MDVKTKMRLLAQAIINGKNNITPDDLQTIKAIADGVI